jgi:hypothetical protein
MLFHLLRTIHCEGSGNSPPWSTLRNSLSVLLEVLRKNHENV